MLLFLCVWLYWCCYVFSCFVFVLILMFCVVACVCLFVVAVCVSVCIPFCISLLFYLCIYVLRVCFFSVFMQVCVYVGIYVCMHLFLFRFRYVSLFIYGVSDFLSYVFISFISFFVSLCGFALLISSFFSCVCPYVFP